MSRKTLVVACGLVSAVAALSAQGVSAPTTGDRKAIQSIRIKVIGCVVDSPSAGHYRLTDASFGGDGVPSSVATAGRRAAGEDLSFENSRSFDLIGDHLKPHVGQKVEIVGITSDAKLNKTDSFRSTIGVSAHQTATLTVRSVRMIAATCP